LLPNHLADLKSSGLSDEAIIASGCYSVDRREAITILGIDPGCDGLAFPYPSSNGKPQFARIKPDTPYKAPGWKKPAKYLTPAGEKNRLYIPATLDQSVLPDPTVPLIVTEGEKKALKATAEGFPCVALPGVWSWAAGKDSETGQRHTIHDLDLVTWKGRVVHVCYDSDAVTNEQVQKAERALAEHLQSRGAEVKAVRLPGGPDGEKVGLDDFLVQQGPKALRKFLEKAQHPATEGILEDPIFVDAALAFVDNEVLVSRMFRETRTVEKGKGDEKQIAHSAAWTPRLISSDRRIISIPSSRSNDREEIIPLGEGYYFRKRPDSATTRWSTESIQAFLSGTVKPPGVPALYDELIKIWKTWVYLPEESGYHLVVLHVLGSYFFELFPAYPYLHFNGPPDSGKSTNGRLCAALGFNGLFLIDPSEASLFRTIEREKPYLVIDEKENAANRQDSAANPGLMALLKAGYQKGARVPRQNTRNVEITEYYSAYSPKVICNVFGLEDVLADRSIPIITKEAPVGSKIRGEQPDLGDSTWQPVRDKLHLALMHYHREVRELRDADLGEEFSRLREKELFKPLIDLAFWVDAHRGTPYAVREIVEALSTKREVRKFTRSLTPETQLCEALMDMLEDKDTVEVHAGQIRDSLAGLSTDSPVWFNERWLGKILRTLGIWRNNRDEKRKWVSVSATEGQLEETKKLRHYVIRRTRIPDRIRDEVGPNGDPEITA